MEKTVWKQKGSGPSGPGVSFAQYRLYKSLLIMMVPALLWYVLFMYLPMYGLTISFKDFKITRGILASPWAGLKYYRMAFESQDFRQVFRNTLIISGMKLVLSFPAPIILALLLNEVRCLAFKKVAQTVSYLPYFLSWVVLGGIVISFLSPSTGPLNLLLKALGFQPINFVSSRFWFRPVVVVSALWKDIGWASIVYLAALANVNPQLYEAACIDGAGRLKQVFHITLPAISPIVMVMLIFSVGRIVNDDFDQIFNLYNPAVYSVGDVLSTYIYKVGLENMRYSYSAAVEFFKNTISFALVLSTNRIAKKFNEYGLW